MPTETTQAVQWAYTQNYTDHMTGQTSQITRDMPSPLVDAVREYFNQNNITYPTFSYLYLQPYL